MSRPLPARDALTFLPRDLVGACWRSGARMSVGLTRLRACEQ
ncbi:hypothetical protein [Prauserella marina]|nr:hypothetical protein [Prauserella marina]